MKSGCLRSPPSGQNHHARLANLNLAVSGFYKEETQCANTVPLKGVICDVPEIHQFYEFYVG
jgi:hypothetical protein